MKQQMCLLGVCLGVCTRVVAGENKTKHHWCAREIGRSDGNVGAATLPLPPPLLGITLNGMLNGTLPPMSSPPAPVGGACGTDTPATGSARCLTRRTLPPTLPPTLLGSHPWTVPMVVYPSSPSSARGTGIAMLPLPPPPPLLLLHDNTVAPPESSMPPDCCTRGTASSSPSPSPPLPRLITLWRRRKRRRRATSATATTTPARIVRYATAAAPVITDVRSAT